mmetsp:Transcript_4792/g.6766  ORF Transcript_4792/g.6766 Transcript_4792/m.6766 type:complete len:365 (+) Transcript_4792:164-1258(+)
MDTKVFDVCALDDTQQVDVVGTSLGDLRAAIRDKFNVPTFEQTLVYKADGEDVVITGDDSVLLKEKPGLLEASVLYMSRQVDPRHQMEKQTAFLEALVACRYSEAKEILKSSGVSIDPNFVHTNNNVGRFAAGLIRVTECPARYRHPALTVAIQSGLETAVAEGIGSNVVAWMSHEGEVAEIAQMLIERAADVNATGDETQDCESAGWPDVCGKTPLCAAIQRGSPVLVKMLLDAKADPNHTHSYGSCAYGPDELNPFGPGVLKPESWFRSPHNGSVSRSPRSEGRWQHKDEILRLLNAAGRSEAPPNKEYHRCVKGVPKPPVGNMVYQCPRTKTWHPTAEAALACRDGGTKDTDVDGPDVGCL